jgi:SAM-dependent methyltransferase
MGLASTPEHHADFYRRAFQSVTGGSGAPRVLVSGAADYSMLAHVLAFYRERGVEPAVTVVDRCDTALFLNRWYAQRESASVERSRCDILEYAAGAPFDAVCTHSFLVWFSPEQRIRLLAKWRQLLRPGGAVITVTRVRATAGTERVRFSPEQAQSFRATVLGKAESMRALLQLDPAEMAHEADIFMNGQRPWPVRSRAEIQQLFERSGFRVDEMSDAPPAATEQQPFVSAVPGSGEIVQIIATRL